jgi:predicted nucleotidyltransferase
MIAEHVETVGRIKNEVNTVGGSTGLIMLSGAHMYGFESRDSDYDYRGFYIMRTGKLLELKQHRSHELLDPEYPDLVPKVDVSLMELRKFMLLAIYMNCNVLEHIYAKPLYSTIFSIELKALIKDCMNKRGLYESYKGMADFNYKKYILTGNKKTIKKYLYVFRALMAGIHALRTKTIEPNIVKLNEIFDNRIVAELIRDKRLGMEDDLANKKYGGIDDTIAEYRRIIDLEYENCNLPIEPTKEQFDDANKWLKRVRQRHWDWIQ